MRVELVLPAEYLGEVIGTLDRREGTVLEVAERGTTVEVIQGRPRSGACSGTRRSSDP